MYRPISFIFLMALITLMLASCRIQRNITQDPANTMIVKRDIAYFAVEGVNPKLLSLDIYSPAQAQNAGVVLGIHGGAWSFGDKANGGFAANKATFFTSHEYIFVSINYRLSPAVQHPTNVQDVASAISFVYQHIAEYGGDPNRIALIGHSAGAQLAALVATDERYLQAHDLGLNILRGVVLLDGAGYDLPAQIKVGGPILKNYYLDTFTTDEASQRDASPLFHVAAGKSIPPFLIIPIASRTDSQAQSQALAGALQAAGVQAEVVIAENKTHETLNTEFGLPDDIPTQIALTFLESILR
jgi:arylformamidase